MNLILFVTNETFASMTCHIPSTKHIAVSHKMKITLQLSAINASKMSKVIHALTLRQHMLYYCNLITHISDIRKYHMVQYHLAC